MRILLDECVPGPAKNLLVGHECITVQERGWSGVKNGELLRLAETEFGLFITSDQGIRYQQNLIGRRIAVLEISTNDYRRIRAGSVELQAAVDAIRPGEFRRLELP